MKSLNSKEFYIFVWLPQVPEVQMLKIVGGCHSWLGISPHRFSAAAWAEFGSNVKLGKIWGFNLFILTKF